MTNPINEVGEKDRERAEEIFKRVNDSYMVFNKGAKYGINHNTEIIMLKLIQDALSAQRHELEAEGDRLANLLSVKTGVSNHPLDSTISTVTRLGRKDVEEIKESLSHWEAFKRGR